MDARSSIHAVPGQPSSTDLAWAAGFLDGDGCFTLNKHSSRGTHPTSRSLHVGAVQVGTAPLEVLEQMLGGKVTRLGITKGGNEIHQWRLSSADNVKRVVPMLLPYLRFKRREAEIVLEFAQTMRPRGRVPNGVEAHPRHVVAKRELLISELAMIRGRGPAKMVAA